MDKSTGNPVFDFKADHRVSAHKFQNRLLKGGLACAVIFGLAAVLADTTPRIFTVLWGLSLVGVCMVFSGIAWGFHWRKALRDDFRREYGPKS